jgi:hypothetical protein
LEKYKKTMMVWTNQYLVKDIEIYILGFVSNGNKHTCWTMFDISIIMRFGLEILVTAKSLRGK